MITTAYYDEFIRYSKMAAIQQAQCNLGSIKHAAGTVKDPLMRNVHLYDVVERKYAGFTQLILDMKYGTTRQHPYRAKLHEVRLNIANNFDGWAQERSLAEWLYVFLVHRVTGSGINYAKSPSGYHNTVLPEFYKASSIKQMVKIIRGYSKPKFTSVGYQFPAFPKPTSAYTRGGDYFMCEIMPALATDLAKFLEKGGRKDLRQIGGYMFKWNTDRGFRQYKFQYAAVIADIADFYPDYVNVHSPFYYGTNAIECISYMATSKQLRGQALLDAVVERAVEDTGYAPYNVEDQMCDCIRWIENYIRPGADYDHVCRDSVWSTSKILDHPFGRQKKMLELGLIESFNKLNKHPSDNYILKLNNMAEIDYRRLCNANA